MKKKDIFEVKKIPTKNYYIVLIVSVLVIVLTLYVRSFYLNYQLNNMEDSIFNVKSIKQINIDDIDFVVNESGDAILYVGYSGNKEINSMERKLYKVIENKDLTDKLLYLDVTSLMEEETYKKILKEKFPSLINDNTEAPLIIYIEDGEGVDIRSSEKELISSKSLKELLVKYGIE